MFATEYLFLPHLASVFAGEKGSRMLIDGDPTDSSAGWHPVRTVVSRRMNSYDLLRAIPARGETTRSDDPT